MARETVVLLVNGEIGRPRLEQLLSEFDWSLENVATLEGLADISARGDVVAVVVDPAAAKVPWRQAISAVRKVAPKALPIVCHRLSNAIDWVEASTAGAFDLLGLPLDMGELRQSLGFAWAAKNKRFQLILMTEPERSRVLRKSAAAGARGSRATGHVA